MCLWRCLWMRLAFDLNWCIQQIAFPNVGGHRPICWGPNISHRKEKFAPLIPASLLELKHLISSSLTLGLAFTSLAPFVLRLWDLDWITPLAFLGLQIINGSSWDFTVSIITWANSSFHIYVHAYIHTQTYTRPTGSVYLENPNTVNNHTYKHKDIHGREESIKKII